MKADLIDASLPRTLLLVLGVSTLIIVCACDNIARGLEVMKEEIESASEEGSAQQMPEIPEHHGVDFEWDPQHFSELDWTLTPPNGFMEVSDEVYDALRQQWERRITGASAASLDDIGFDVAFCYAKGPENIMNAVYYDVLPRTKLQRYQQMEAVAEAIRDQFLQGIPDSQVDMSTSVRVFEGKRFLEVFMILNAPDLYGVQTSFMRFRMLHGLVNGKELICTMVYSDTNAGHAMINSFLDSKDIATSKSN